MVCETAEELQARLCFGAVCLAADQDADCDRGEPLFQRKLQRDIEEVLELSLSRRLARLEARLAVLAGAGRPAGAAAAAGQAPSAPAPRPADSKALARAAIKKALRTADARSKPNHKVYGPTMRQRTLPDPPEPIEELVIETVTLSRTLESVEGRATARQRQLVSLHAQAKTATAVCEERRLALAASEARLGEAASGDAAAKRLQEASLEEHRETVDALHGRLCAQRREACETQELIVHQRRFMRQLDQLTEYGGVTAAGRHPCGDIALAVRPPPVGDDIPQAADIGTSVANPYVVDSWPFEPNVLARRAPTEGTMQPLVEESAADVERERQRIPFRCFGPPQRMDGEVSEEEESDQSPGRGGGGEDDEPPSTSRSL